MIGFPPVNGKVATMETVINHNDLICHRVHRHEPPVTAQPLKIIHCDDKLVVLDKPSSIPVSKHASLAFAVSSCYAAVLQFVLL